MFNVDALETPIVQRKPRDGRQTNQIFAQKFRLGSPLKIDAVGKFRRDLPIGVRLGREMRRQPGLGDVAPKIPRPSRRKQSGQRQFVNVEPTPNRLARTVNDDETRRPKRPNVVERQRDARRFRSGRTPTVSAPQRQKRGSANRRRRNLRRFAVRSQRFPNEPRRFRDVIPQTSDATPSPQAPARAVATQAPNAKSPTA